MMAARAAPPSRVPKWTMFAPARNHIVNPVRVMTVVVPRSGSRNTRNAIGARMIRNGIVPPQKLLASAKPVFDAKTFLISSNAGPSQLAGENCSEWFFSTSWQNDQTPMALGELLNQGKENLDAWWISVTTFAVLVTTLLLLILIGDALRDALDPRKVLAGDAQ